MTPQATLPTPLTLTLPQIEAVASLLAVPPQPAPSPTPGIELPQPRTLGPGSPPPGGLPPAGGQPGMACELPTAPANLMVPPGAVPGKHGSFGSDPISISRDYPSIWDLCVTPLRDRITAGLVDDKPAINRGYVEAEYLMWWMNGMKVPFLATTTTSPTGMGFLGQPGTVPIIGPGAFLGDFREGVRLRAGYWFDDCQTCGIDGSFFVLGQRDADAAVGFHQYSVITRPIYSPNPIPGTTIVIGQTGEAVAVPGALDGVLTVHAQSILFGGDANLTHCLYSDCNSRATVFAGYRNLDLIESITINENIDVVGAGSPLVSVTDPIGTKVHVQDRFGTANYFNGGQIGGTYDRVWGKFDVEARASIAFGATQQNLDISGFQTVVLPSQAVQMYRGGLLAVGPNLGDFTRDRFSVAPEVTLNLGYWITPSLRVHVGYNFLYWTNVIRPGEQIDREVNLAYVPNGPPVGASSAMRPTTLFQESNLLVHGVEFGLEWRW